MGNTNTLDRVPGHLREFVVHQDYSSYDSVDQSVWRFILLQTFNELKHAAHPIYVEGLEKTGIHIERIPRIEEMDACLSNFGWGAVCVDGFIPPRAFQEFQALGILTVAAEIRTAKHLAYTPAPDIVHESAGHSPIIPHPDYRHFLQRFGELGKKAFASREDRRVYNAIRTLSIVKEEPATTGDQLAAAEQELTDSIAAVSRLAEAALLSRLHWWTVEYGLVGGLDNFKVYGAGLLSSVGETHFLQKPDVAKIPLTAGCVDVSYDITKPQPQLFVVEEFADLNAVLDEVVSGFAFRVGGRKALEEAIFSGEVGTVVLNSGLQITGELSRIYDGDAPCAYLSFTGPCALALNDKQLPGHGKDHHPMGYGTPVGRLEDGTELSRLREADLSRLGYKGAGSKLSLRYKSGVRLEGRLVNVTCGQDGYLMLLTFEDCRVRQGDTLLFDPEWGVYDMAVGESVPSVFAGAADVCYWPVTPFSEKRVPKPKGYSQEERRLVHLFEQALSVWGESQEPKMMSGFREISEKLAGYPDHWLLRWNLLECLVKKERQGGDLADRLKSELLEIESRFYREAPIGMGLRYLGLSDANPVMARSR